MEFTFEETDYTNGSQIFHVINDQNNRNIISGETRDFFLGDNIRHGELKYSKSKQFVFWGVYSGEFKWDEEVEIAGDKHTFKNSYGLGNVWYSYLVPEIINDGVSFTE